MHSATGFIRATGSGTKITASFTIDGILHTFSASLTPSLQDFYCANATLHYESVGELTATRAFNGRFGKEDISINIAPGNPGRIKITGDLDMPISPASTISGNGSWTSN
ncbi:hypothetical protein AB1N83_009751 [Pleurotus pulmonarius]